jgi:DNA-binding protein H-NS
MPRQNYAVLQAKIEKEIEKLRKQSAALQTKKRRPVIQSIVRSMKEYDITPEEITAAFGKGAGRKPRVAKSVASVARGVRKPVAPKYRHPQSGATWTGRGKPPRWMAQAEAGGESRESFLIK